MLKISENNGTEEIGLVTPTPGILAGIGLLELIWSFQFCDLNPYIHTVYPKKYAHGFVVLCFVVVMQSFIMNSHEVFIHNHQGCFAGTGAIVRLPQCQWSKPDGYGKISQCMTTTKHSKAKTVYIFLGIYCRNFILNDYIFNIIKDEYHDMVIISVLTRSELPTDIAHISNEL